MKHFFSLLLFFICFSNSFSQNKGWVEKNIINNLILYKAYIQNGDVGEGRILTPNNPKYADGYQCIYFDSEGNMRKYISWFDYPESFATTIAYYNEKGELIYIISCNYQPEGYSYQGIAFKTVNDDYDHNIEFKYKVQYNEMNEFENYTIQGNSNKYQAIVCDLNLLELYANVEALAVCLAIEEMQPPQKCKKVQFTKPSKDQKTFTNYLNINIREDGKTSSAIINTIDCGITVKIVDILPEENVGNFGNHNWYKIEYNNYNNLGYIFGAFLEPVEKEI
jgi:hypothetical protein